VLQTAIVRGEAADSDESIRLLSESRRVLAGLRGKAVKNNPAPGPLSMRERLALESGEEETA
jgi:hypothetical protein